ncbi:LysR family transcriptional regulator [Pseudomonas edaphica]|uniref:LysR family transcriptional regulator n=1 Tax=Pseudomonas edaphica TaxID=2006980 RepID=UPI003D09C1A4
MFDWESLRHFIALGRAGTLSGAARALAVDHATVSRRIAALENELQTKLVERLPRSCTLTASGAQVFDLATAMEASAFGIERMVRAEQTPLSGKVTVSAPPVLVTHLLAHRLSEFRAKYPEITLSMSAQPQQVSLSRREADVALRLTRPEEPNNVVRKIGHIPYALYASPSYTFFDNPERWAFIAYDAQFVDLPQQQWLMQIAGERRIGCELSDVSSQLVAACSGAGIAGLPRFLGDAQPGLKRIEYDGAPFSRDVWLVVHHDLKRSVPIRAVMDFLTDTVKGVGL